LRKIEKDSSSQTQTIKELEARVRRLENDNSRLTRENATFKNEIPNKKKMEMIVICQQFTGKKSKN